MVEPTGQLKDGTPCYTEEDIRQGTEAKPKFRTNLIQSGEYLRLDPSGPKNGDKYIGDSTVLKCYTDKNGTLMFRCMHVLKKADKEKGTAADLCSKTFVAGPKANIGSFRSHCRGGHWPKVVLEGSLVGQSGMMQFFAQKSSKKQKTTNVDQTSSKSCAVGAHKDVQPSQQSAAADNTATVGTSTDNVDSTTERSSKEVISSDKDGERVQLNSQSTRPQQQDKPAPDGGDIVDTTEMEVEIEEVYCNGISHKGLPNISLFPGYSFNNDYPASIHSPHVQEKYGNGKTNFLPRKIDWSFDSNGTFKSLECQQLIRRDKNNNKEVEETTSLLGKPMFIFWLVMLEFSFLLIE